MQMGAVQNEVLKCTFEPQINPTSQILVEMQIQLQEMGLDNQHNNGAQYNRK